MCFTEPASFSAGIASCADQQMLVAFTDDFVQVCFVYVEIFFQIVFFLGPTE